MIKKYEKEELENSFKSNLCKIGDIVQILQFANESKRYVPARIEQIYKKDGYNAYLCKHTKLGYKMIFTDKDINDKCVTYKRVKLANEVSK